MLQETSSRKCLACKTNISHRRSNAKYCSNKCSKSQHFRGTYCIQCGKGLITANPKSRFCSWACIKLSRNPHFNQDYFAVPNLENSYWAGFIAADGCIYRRAKGTRTLSIGLQLKDKQHLINLKSRIGAGSLSDVKHYNENGRTYHSVTFLVYSDKICNDLGSNFNIYPQKSLTLSPPTLKGDLALAYIAGYIDGDGSYTRSNNRPVISIVGTAEVLQWIANIAGVEKNPRNHKNIHEMTLHGNDAINVRKSFEQLDLPLLDRKKNRWEELGLNLSML